MFRPTRSPFLLAPALAAFLTAVSSHCRADDAAENALKRTALNGRGLATTKVRTLKQKHAIAGVDMNASTLVLRSRSPLALFVNRAEAAAGKKNFDDFLGQWRRDLKELAHDKATLSGDYSYEDKAALTFYDPANLICVRHESSLYLGGAHGTENVTPVCYGYKAGAPARLTLGDFFKPGTAYRALVTGRLMAGLKANPNAMWVEDGTMKSISTEQLGNFQAEPDGLRWWFNPYEASPYAVGSLEVKLTTKDLGPGLRRELFAAGSR